MDNRGNIGAARPETAYEREMREKQQAAREYANQTTAPADCSQQATTKGWGGDCRPMMTRAEVIIADLRSRAISAEHRTEGMKRALDILDRHPEFLEFIELQSLGVI